MATLPYWNNDEVISSDKLNSMVQAIINGDPLAVKVSNATKNDVNQIVGYLSSLHDSAKTNLNSATSTSDFDTAYNNMTALVSNKLGSYANDDTVDLYSTGIRASIITFLQAYDNMMSNDRLNNKNTDNTLNGRIDSESQTRANADTNINNSLNAIKANGGGRNLALGTSNSWATAPDVDRYNITTIATYTNAQAGDVFTVSVDTQSTKALAWQIWQGSSEYERSEYVTGGDNPAIASGTTHSYTTFTWPSGATQYLIVQLINNTTDGSHASYQYKNVMLEKGTVAHDWQPAPEDTNTVIENVNAKADANTASISKIISNGGGRNLLTGTSSDWIAKTASGWMNVTTAKSNKTSVADYNVGDKFTYSVTVNNASDSDVLLEMYRCDTNGNRIVGVPGYLANSDYVAPNTHHKRISCTISIDENTWFVEHTLIAAGGTSTSKTVYLKGEMFEVGTVAHDWSPNPDEVQSQLDNLNANKLSSADANWNLVAKNSSNTYNYTSGSKITLPNGSSITVKDDRIVPYINLPRYLTDYTNNNDLNVIATSCGECDNLFIPSATMATLSNRPTNPDTNDSLTGDCFYTYHYAYSGTTVRAFQKIYSCDYNYVFIRSYTSSPGSWSNWSCLTPYA